MAEAFDVRNEQRSTSDKELEVTLRPKQFGEFAGQKAVTDNLKIFVKAAKLREEASTMSCCMALQDSVRPHWPISSHRKWASAFA